MRLAAGWSRPPRPSARCRARAGRGGGTSLPGKVLTRLEPHAIGRLAGRLPHGSVVISATNGKTTTAAMVASILERTGTRLVHNRAGANMAGGVASALAAAHGAAAASSTATWASSRSTSSGSAASSSELEPRALLLANLFRDQLDRYGELETIADRWAEVVAAARRRHARWCSTPTTRWSPTSAATATRARTSASRTTRWRCRRCSTPRTPSTAAAAAHAYVYDAIYLGHLGRYHCPNCGAAAARARRSSPRDVALHGIRAAAFTLRTPGGERRVELPAARALQRLQRARRRGAVPARSGVALGRHRGRAWRPSRPPSAAPRRSRSAAAPTVDPAGQEPGRRQRGPAHAGARGRASSTCSACSTTTSPTAATSPGSGTPTSSCSRRRVRRMTCAGTRAAELAVRLKYAGVDPARLHVVEDLEAGPRRRAGRRRRARSTRCPPTRRCWSCASCSPGAARRRRYWR